MSPTQYTRIPSGTRRSFAAATDAFSNRFRNGFAQDTNIGSRFLAPIFSCAHTRLPHLVGEHTWEPPFAAPLQRGLCRRRKRGTVKGDRNRGRHHVKQDAHPSGIVEPLERAHKVGKRSRQDANFLTRD
jgi:hypothetical protein